MANNWRPEEWENLFTPAAITVRDRNNKIISHYEAYEYGADAMLEAVKKLGEYYNDVNAPYKTIGVLKEIREKGWLIFIPDTTPTPTLPA